MNLKTMKFQQFVEKTNENYSSFRKVDEMEDELEDTTQSIDDLGEGEELNLEDSEENPEVVLPEGDSEVSTEIPSDIDTGSAMVDFATLSPIEQQDMIKEKISELQKVVSNIPTNAMTSLYKALDEYIVKGTKAE